MLVVDSAMDGHQICLPEIYLIADRETRSQSLHFEVRNSHITADIEYTFEAEIHVVTSAVEVSLLITSPPISIIIISNEVVPISHLHED
jgi:hypothetical protein